MTSPARARWWGIAGAGLAVATALAAARAWREPEIARADPLVVRTAYEERQDTVRRGETLAALFARHGIHGKELYAVLAAADGLEPRRVREGQTFVLRYALDAERPSRITARLGHETILVLRRDSGASWSGSSRPIEWRADLQLVHGTIRSSLYETLEGAIPDSVLPSEQRARLVWDLADGVFGWVIDFTRDVYDGDAFGLLVERLTSPEGEHRFGRIVAARIETRGRPNTAYVVTGPDGRNTYYDAAGRSLKRAFKLSPVPYRITSRFARRRYHPILRVHRPHLGVDFGAPHGADVRVTGDGIVTRAGRWGGYGLMVAVRHPKDIETRYAHLSALAPGIRPGAAVRQGERIGFAGATGLATGPHVHYEFLKNERHVDPRSAVRFGDGEPLPVPRRAEFDSIRAFADRFLDPHPTAVAAGGG